MTIGRYGFNGYKGCPGAEFFRCGSTTSVGSLTEEECRSFRLGMTPKEAETFLVLRDQMWNGYTPDDTCSDTPVSSLLLIAYSQLTANSASFWKWVNL